ncbi:MAG: HepT-like ribonuclease domain-containing protein [Methanosarcinales archaeon]
MVVKLKKIHAKVKEKLPFISEIATTKEGLLALWLFGSYAKGCENMLSDIDIAYLPKKDLSESQIEKLDKELYLQISSLFETDEISFINLRDAPLDITFSVMRDGKLLFCNYVSELESFKGRILNLYPEVKRLKRYVLLVFEKSLRGVDMKVNTEKVLYQLRLLKQDLEKLREKSILNKEEYLADEDSKIVVERKFQTATECCVNIGNHLISVMNLKMAEDYASVFHILGEADVISRELALEMADMARFRNLLVHLYWKINHEKIYDNMEKRIETLERFTTEVLKFIEEP